jgi:hypothetical protein
MFVDNETRAAVHHSRLVEVCMKPRKIINLAMAAIVGIGGIFVVATPASAGDEICTSIDEFITSAATGKYVSYLENQDGLLRAQGTVPGWFEHFFLCYKAGWALDEWDFKADKTGKFVSADLSGAQKGVPKARNTNIGYSEWFRVEFLGSDAAGPYYAIRQRANGNVLSVHPNGDLRFDDSHIGWNQAFRFSNPCSLLTSGC